MYQRDRGYKLIVGDYNTEQGILIENLHVTFDVSKNSDNKKGGNSATLEIYNLSDATLKKFETDFLACEFYCGYKEIGINRLFSGNVVELTTRRSGTDKVTQLILGEGYTALNQQRLSSTIPSDKKVEDVVEEIRKKMPGVVRGTYAGVNCQSPITFGYPLSGTPKQALDEVCKAYGMEYNLDRGVLNISDNGGLIDKAKATAFVLNKNTGLIEIPYYTQDRSYKEKENKSRKSGLQFKALLNTEIVPGKLVKIESDGISGFFKVTSTRHYGGYRDNDWYVEGFCLLPDAEELE